MSHLLARALALRAGQPAAVMRRSFRWKILNLHFTGDFHAITSANNLLAALLDNHIQQGNALGIDSRQILWKRCLDMNDRVLRNIVVGLGAKADGVVREDHFVITVASEIMAILCLADDMDDLKERLGKNRRCL